MRPRIPPEHAEEIALCFKECSAQVHKCMMGVVRGDRTRAEELVQEAFMAAAGSWSQVRTYSDEARVAWLCRVGTNISVSGFRKERTAVAHQGEVWSRFRSSEAGPHRQVIAKMTLELCWEVIEEMPERQHLVAHLRWRMGMTNSEIAKALGITRGAVSAHLSNARAALRLMLGPDVLAGWTAMEEGA
jgi:RNA polymerase sigma factor (sigma-70 family)